jgi:hypothetical protein
VIVRATATRNPGDFPPVKRTTLRVTVAAECALQVRRALIVACGDSIELLRIETVPRTSQVRVYFVMDEQFVRDAMLAVVRTVRRGEVGRVTPQRA